MKDKFWYELNLWIKPMTEEEQNTCNCEHEHHIKNENEIKKTQWMKYLGIIGATLLGSFLAFYFVADMTIKHLTDPSYQFKKMNKIMEHHSREMDKIDKKMMKEIGMPDFHKHKSMVMVERDDDEYKIIVDLRAFDNNEKNVKFDINNNMATVSASIEKEKKHEDSIIEFSQTFYLSGNIDKNKIKKEKERNQYIITIPLKDTNND